jgi:hypothetical protein
VTIIIFHLPEWSPIDDGMFLIPAWTLFAFVGHHRHTSEFNPLHSSSRVLLALEEANAVEARLFEGFKKEVFPEGAGYATAPKIRVLFEALGNILVTHDVRDHSASSTAKDSEDSGE